MAAKKMKFSRYGGLSSVKQSHYEVDSDCYHTPPARKGIYALPYGFRNDFLIMKVYNEPGEKIKLPPYMEYVKDKNGKKVVYNYSQRNADERPKEVNNPHYDPNIDHLSDSIYSYKKDYFPIDVWKKVDKNGDPISYDENNFVCRYFIKRKKARVFDYSGLIWSHLHEYVKVKESDIIDCKGSWILTNMKAYIHYYNFAKNLSCWKDYKNGEMRFTMSPDGFEVFIEKVN